MVFLGIAQFPGETLRAMANKITSFKIFTTGSMMARVIGTLIKNTMLAKRPVVSPWTCAGVAMDVVDAGAGIQARSQRTIFNGTSLSLAGGSCISGWTCARKTVQQVNTRSAIFAGVFFTVISINFTIFPLKSRCTETLITAFFNRIPASCLIFTRIISTCFGLDFTMFSTESIWAVTCIIATFDRL